MYKVGTGRTGPKIVPTLPWALSSRRRQKSLFLFSPTGSARVSRTETEETSRLEDSFVLDGQGSHFDLGVKDFWAP